MSSMPSGVSHPCFSSAISSLLFLAINASLSLVCGEETPDSLTGSEVRLAEIREKVEQAEALYRNFDVKYAVMTQGMFPAGASAPDLRVENPNLDNRDDWDSIIETHAVRQGERFRTEQQVYYPKSGNKHARITSVTVYDGHEMKTQKRSSINQGPEHRETFHATQGPDPLLYSRSPHLLMWNLNSGSDLRLIPLSVLLGGHDAIMNHYPRLAADLEADIKDKYVYHTVYSGSTTLDGIDCEKISIRRLPTLRAKPWSSVVLWLAKSRNYLPVQIQFFSQQSRSEETCRTKELREIAPGVWYPFQCEWFTLQTDKKSEPQKSRISNRMFLVVREVSLAPAHDPNDFELSLPQDAQISPRLLTYPETIEKLEREKIETVARLKAEFSKPLTNPAEIRHRAVGDRVAGVDRRSEIVDSLWSQLPKKYLTQIVVGSIISLWILLLFWRYAIKNKVANHQKEADLQSTGFPPK